MYQMVKLTVTIQVLLGLLIPVSNGLFNAGQYVNTKIVNGTEALPGEFPYAVSLRYNNSHDCGGSIIGNEWILTAAHCIYLDYIDLLTVLYGSVYLRNSQGPRGLIAEVSEVYVNEDYVPFGGYENDIALVRLREPITFNRYAQMLSLPRFMAVTPTDRQSVLLGWGYPETDTEVVMEILQVVRIFVFPDDVCTFFHGDLFDSVTHICAGIPGGGKGQCTGDSGGPLTINNIQYGIVSWSDKPCATTPGVLVRVATYREWIFEKTGL